MNGRNTGPQPHHFREDKIACPACENGAGRLACDHCEGEGKLMRWEAKMVQLKLDSKNSPTIR